jgi:sterol 3beta-glucosyltransferase
MPVPDHEAFLEMAAELCEALNLRALIGAGWTDMTMQACDLPDNLAIVEQADHAWLFPQCAAIVHHGGAGTTHAGLSAGVPNVVCSFFADQPFWGKQVKRLGVGSHLPFQNMGYASLKRALLDAMEEAVQRRAADLGGRLRQEQGTLRACEALENRLLSPS